MTPFHAFGDVAATWQNFYMLVGTAAATLLGLMFVAVTFGASLVTAETAQSARAFLDPPFAHFVTVLLAACLMLIPAMTPTVLGGVLIGVTLFRTAALVRVRRHMVEAHARHGDVELSDWLMGVVLPAACYAALLATGAGFITGHAVAFAGLAAVNVVFLLLGIFSAWELMIWLALSRQRAKG